MQVKTFEEFEAAEKRGDKGIFMVAEGNGDRVWVWNLCPGCGQRSALRIGSKTADDNSPCWQMTNREPLTLSPSVWHNVPECGWHGYLRDGGFVT